MKPVHQSSLNPSPCQLFILWDFVHFSGCGILSCGILSVGILSCGILSSGILSGMGENGGADVEIKRFTSVCCMM